MTARQQGRGRHLLMGDSGAVPGGMVAWLSRQAPAPIFHAMVERLDRAMMVGSITGHLPDGTTRTVGGRGPGPDAVIHIHSWAALARLLLAGSNGWFRAWMAGEWTSDDPVAAIAAFSANRRSLADIGRAQGPLRWAGRLRHMLRRNDRRGARRNIVAHYDLGNDFYAAWLDAGMVYSSARFDPSRPDEALEDAQLRKIDAALARLQLKSGDQLLEIGCGWGALGLRTIRQHGIAYTGLTLSDAQADFARSVLPAEAHVAIRDYRDEPGVYDAIVSIEMVEAVGQDFWPDYLDMIARCLKPGGRAAIQYIAIDDAIFDAYSRNADFIQTYVFPGGCLVSESRFRDLAEARGLAWHDKVAFSLDYAKTLHHWRVRYEAALAAGTIPGDFDPDFHRLWRYYLMYCEAGFRGGGIDVAQVTLIKSDTAGS